MKTNNALALSLLIFAIGIGNVQAGHGQHRSYHPTPPAHHHGHHHGNHHRHRLHWGVPAAALAITGLAIGAAAYPTYQPRPSYTYNPPPVLAPPPLPEHAYWYLCASSGIYYPYTRSCPEGWQLVSPTP